MQLVAVVSQVWQGIVQLTVNIIELVSESIKKPCASKLLTLVKSFGCVFGDTIPDIVTVAPTPAPNTLLIFTTLPLTEHAGTHSIVPGVIELANPTITHPFTLLLGVNCIVRLLFELYVLFENTPVSVLNTLGKVFVMVRLLVAWL